MYFLYGTLQAENKKERTETMKSKQQIVFPYLMLLPTIVIFGVYLFYPALSGFWYSLHKWDGINDQVFIGLKNYATLLQDTGFWESMIRTLLYTVISVPLVYVVSLIFALLITQPIRGQSAFRAILYWPTMISSIIVGLSWKFLLGEDFGVVNYVITSLGGESVRWLTNSTMAMFTVVFVTVWSMAGYYMVMFVAGLNSIDQTYYEAAQIDGATPWQQFRFITLPLLKPTTLLVLVLSFISIIKSYPLVYALTEGGPGTATKFMVQTIYETGFAQNKMGYACAMAMVLFVLLALMTAIQFKLNKGGEQDAM